MLNAEASLAGRYLTFSILKKRQPRHLARNLLNAEASLAGRYLQLFRFSKKRHPRLLARSLLNAEASLVGRYSPFSIVKKVSPSPSSAQLVERRGFACWAILTFFDNVGPYEKWPMSAFKLSGGLSRASFSGAW